MPLLHPFWRTQMEGMQANLNAVWMHLQREQPHAGLPSTRTAHKQAARDLSDMPERQGESVNAQLDLDVSRGIVGNDASRAKPRTIDRYRM